MTPRRCDIQQEAITALILGVIDSQQAEAILEHLAVCSDCMALYDELTREEAFLQAAFAKMRAASEAASLQAAQMAGDGSVATKTAISLKFGLRGRQWRYLSSVAVAAVLLLAVTGLFSWLDLGSFSQGTAFAAVVQQIGTARSVTYKKTVQFEGGPTIVRQELASDRGIFRSASPRGVVVLLDFADKREIRFDPRRKVAVVVRKSLRDKRTLTGYLGWFEPLHQAEGIWIGHADLDGRKANVYSIRKPFLETTIWTDLQTNLPVRVESVEMPCLDKDVRIPEMHLAVEEFRSAQGPARNAAQEADPDAERWFVELLAPGVRREKLTTTLTDFAWNATIDESLLRVAAPEGCEIVETDDGNPPQEEYALAAALRFWAEASDGTFPSNINMLLDSKPLLIWKYGTSAATPEQAYAEAVKMAYIIVAGSLFAQERKVADNWNYVGDDVMLGQADKPLCWWRTNDPAVCRVIYGDLAIRDLPAADLPPVASPR